MSKAKAKADAVESASATATENAPEPREAPVKKRAVRRSSAAATSEDPDTAVAPASSAAATLPPAPAKAPKSRRKAAEDVEAAEAPVPAEAKPVRATRARKAPAEGDIVTEPDPETVSKAPARARKKVQTAAEIEQQELKFADEVAVAAGSAAPRKPRAAAQEQPVTPAQAPVSAPAPVVPPVMPEVRDVPSYAPPRPEASAPSPAQPAPDRPRKLDPEEEIAEAIAAQAEAKALHAEARARAAEAKAREAEARLRAVEARARATGIDPFADMDGESVVEKAPPLPGQMPRHDQPQNRPQHPQHSQHPRPQGQGGGGQQGGNQQGNNRGNRPETVYQGHGGGGGSGKSKRDKFEWKKNKGRKKPWEQRDRGPENRPGGAPGAPAGGNQLPRGDSGQPVEAWRPGGDDSAAPAPVEARDRENDRDRDQNRDHNEGQSSQGRPERPERPQQPAEDRPVRDPEYGEGIIEISGKGKGFGFLRESVRNYNQSPQDVFVTPEIIRKYNLKDGMKIHGETRRGNRGPQLYKLITINGDPPEKYRKAPAFEELTVINPMERLRLETVPDRYTTRVMDMMTPIGKGQRGLIVAPPRTGKTTMLQHIAEAITINYPDMPLILMLIDERPEEVTELRRALPKAEVIASSNDSEPRAHLRTAQLGIERAKRLVEGGHDVFMLLDSITRMGRAFNNAMHPGGKTGSGGIDSKAMEIPRKIFAAARNTEEAGSLTIIATALVETGSKGDEYIFQEFKGTGNMEVVLDRKISDQLVFPAIDIFQSGTRREELILPPFMLDKINTIRRGLAGTKNIDAISRLLMFLRRFPTNFELLNEIPG